MEVSDESHSDESVLTCDQASKRKTGSKKVYKATKPQLKLKPISTSKMPTNLTTSTVTPHADSKPPPPVPNAAPSVAVAPLRRIDALFENPMIRNSGLVTPRPQQSLQDPVIYFPSAMINCLNSGDNIGLVNLLRQNIDHRCAFGLYCCNTQLSARAFLKFFELMNEIHPDRILTISNSSMVSDHITTATSIKFTDKRMLFDAIARTADEPALMPLFYSDRANHLKRRLCLPNQPEEEKRHIAELAESDSDLVVCGAIEFHAIINEVTNKVTGLYLTGGITSAHYASPKSY